MIDSTKGKAIIVLASIVNHDAAVIKRMEHLDLAVDIKPGTTTSTDEATLNRAFIKVPFGQNTLINRALLQSMGPAKAFHLFPNLPREIRQKIFGYTIEGVTIQVKVTDNGHNWVGQAFPPPELLAASKEAAIRYIYDTKKYVPLFKNGTTLYNEQLDRIVLKLVASVDQPGLTIGPKFGAATTMAAISSVTFEIPNIENGVKWINDNLQGMVNLKTLAMHAFIPISAPGQNEVAFYVVSKDLDRTREQYTHILESEGTQFVDFHAMPEIDRCIVKQTERQGILDLWMMLDRCLKNRTNFPTFPSTVLTGLHWVNDN
jgi:hypothetical protein